MTITNKVFIICTGLGHINRGFETFARECFDMLKGADDTLQFYLFRGGGKSVQSNREFRCWNISRQATVGLLGQSAAYKLENQTFVFSLLPRLIQDRPSLIIISDFYAACYLVYLKRLFRFSYRILFSNGGPSGPPYIFDHVQQLSDYYYQEAIAYGEPPEKHTVLPYGFTIDETLLPLSAHKRTSLKQSLGMPINKKIVLSVGAINMSHKRMDYLINEVAQTDDTFLIILGQIEAETQSIVALAQQKIPNRFSIKMVDKHLVQAYYICADLFVLASLQEGFGRVFIEALSVGLPVCAHDNALTRELLQQHGYLANFTKQGTLASLIKKVLSIPRTELARQERHSFAYDNFSWQALKERYLVMIKQLCTETASVSYA